MRSEIPLLSINEIQTQGMLNFSLISAQETLEQTLEVQDRKNADLDFEKLPGYLFVVPHSFQDAFQISETPRFRISISLFRHDVPRFLCPFSAVILPGQTRVTGERTVRR